MFTKRFLSSAFFGFCLVGVSLFSVGASGKTLDDVKARGVLRHLGIPYANFVTGSGDGLDIELMQGFAEYLGVEYQYVETSWKAVIADLTGKRIKVDAGEVKLIGDAPINGDVVANGFTILPWRQQIVEFSTPTFPSGVWLVARADLPMSPVVDSGNEQADIVAVKGKLAGISVLAMKNTCLDPQLYRIEDTGAKVRFYTSSTNLNEMVPAILRNDAQTTLLDVPDALIALEKWPGEIKIIGPVASEQRMGVAFPKQATRLREAFNAYFDELKRDGRYRKLVEKYYPTVFLYFNDFFVS